MRPGLAREAPPCPPASDSGSRLLGITTQLDELWMRQSRLKAERDGAETVELPSSLSTRADTPEVKEILAGDRRLFESRRSGRAGQKAQLSERINQLTEEVGGLLAQGAAKSREGELIGRELGENEKLWKRNLTPLAKYIALQREATRIGGERHSSLPRPRKPGPRSPRPDSRSSSSIRICRRR